VRLDGCRNTSDVLERKFWNTKSMDPSSSAFWGAHDGAFKLVQKYNAHPQSGIIDGALRRETQAAKSESRRAEIVSAGETLKGHGMQRLAVHMAAGAWSSRHSGSVCKRLGD